MPNLRREPTGRYCRGLLPLAMVNSSVAMLWYQLRVAIDNNLILKDLIANWNGIIIRIAALANIGLPDLNPSYDVEQQGSLQPAITTVSSEQSLPAGFVVVDWIIFYTEPGFQTETINSAR